MSALEKNKTWEIVEKPKGENIVDCKWIFTLKYKANGSLERHKARLVAKWYAQTYGVDYQETFAPIAKMNTVRILLSLATHYNWQLLQYDVKNAFLYGDLDEEIYMNIPPGFERNTGNKVCKLSCSPKNWSLCLGSCLGKSAHFGPTKTSRYEFCKQMFHVRGGRGDHRPFAHSL